MAEKAEFASQEWVELAREYLEPRAAEAADSIRGVDFELCEVFTDPPAHLLRGDPDRVAWYIRIQNGRLEVGDGEIETKLKLTVDYQETLPRAKTIYEGNPAAAAAAQERRQKRIESGELDPAWNEIPEVVNRVLGNLHDHLARLTR